MAEIFRKSSLEKLSSPEQLDKMIVITPPSFWIGLLGAGIIIITALVWSVVGRLPVNVEAQGIYVKRGGIYPVHSKINGIVEEVLVDEGEIIKKGDVIAKIDTEEIDRQIEEMEERISAVENVEMDSKQDVVTADNKSLIDVKGQLITVRQTLDQSLALLDLRNRELEAARNKVVSVEDNFLLAESNYYNSLNVGDATQEQLNYSEAQTEYSTASNYLENAKSGLNQAQVQYAQAQAQYKQALGGYDSYDEYMINLKAAEAGKLTALTELVGASNGNTGISNFNYDVTQLAMDYENATYNNETNFPGVHAAIGAYLTAYQNRMALENNKSAIDNLKATLEQAKKVEDNYADQVEQYSEQKDDADDMLDYAREKYTERMQVVTQQQQIQSKLGNEYTQALNEYNTEISKLVSLENTVEEIKIQVQVDQKNVDAQMQVIQEQFDATKASVLSQLNSEHQKLKQQKEDAMLRATVDGEITNLVIAEGSAVSMSGTVARVQKGNDQDNVIVCYVPVSSGKKIYPGMEVMIYPSTVNKQEYGHMEAVVESVDEYITSAENMQKQLGNDNLVESFLQSGPVVEVTCVLREDENTESGYFWSSKKGADIKIAVGTMVEANVVIEEKAPITMLIPLLKEKLTIQVAN